MAKYNVKFELSVDDVELIESALRQTKSKLSEILIATPGPEEGPQEETEIADESVRRIHDLLGRLHNQKVFYRPQSGAYVGG